MIVERAAVSSRNGQTSTTSSNGTGAALDLERSETRRWRAVAAIATSIRAREGTHNHLRTSEEVSESTDPERTNHDK